MTTPLESARARWLAERGRYEQFGKLVAETLGAAVRARGIWCQVSSRAKELHSLIKKLLKGKHSYDNLSDKVGARCIVRHVDELPIVEAATTDLFHCLKIDRKSETLGAERVGYNGTHIDVCLREGDADR